VDRGVCEPFDGGGKTLTPAFSHKNGRGGKRVVAGKFREAGAEGACQAEASEHVDAQGAEALAADLVAGEAVLLDQGYRPAAAGEQDGRSATGWAGADDGDGSRIERLRDREIERLEECVR
jgi:hypothetical protein